MVNGQKKKNFHTNLGYRWWCLSCAGLRPSALPQLPVRECRNLELLGSTEFFTFNCGFFLQVIISVNILANEQNNLKVPQTLSSVWRIRFILIRIRSSDPFPWLTDPDPTPTKWFVLLMSLLFRCANKTVIFH